MSSFEKWAASLFIVVTLIACGSYFQYEQQQERQRKGPEACRQEFLTEAKERALPAESWLTIVKQTRYATVLEPDRVLFKKFHSLSGSRLDYVFGWTTHLGDVFFLLLLTLIFMLIWDPKRTRRHFLLMLVLILTLELVVHLLKLSFARTRPYHYFYDAIAGGYFPFLPIAPLPLSASFPSGHTALVFAVVAAFNRLYDGRLVGLYLIAAIVALSRIYTGVHFPLDILGGALVGYVWGRLMVSALRRILRLSHPKQHPF